MRAHSLLLLFILNLSYSSMASGNSEYAGSQACAACHTEQHQDWLISHHKMAMASPTRATVAAPFEGERFEHFGNTTQFFQKDGQFFIKTTDSSAEEKTFPVAYTFGIYPLQQYLLPTENGRLQAFTVAWDARPVAEGGQRWYHLNPDEPIQPDDPLHWQGQYQNWNNACAECHSTNLQKNYDDMTQRFTTQFSEVSVGCEACHGPAQEHLAWAQSGDAARPKPEWPSRLNQRGEWAFEAKPIAVNHAQNSNDEQINVCARCHSRRSHLGDYQHGQALSQTHRLALLDPNLYFPDGQIRDEVFVHGSFIQSKMYQAGVTCTDCHNPHSGKVYAQNNALCATCHKAEAFDTPKHHQHQTNSEGALCINCHMPETVYMGVDARRDHSMQIPRPDLSINLGVPNACTRCHQDQSNQWAFEALLEWDQLRRDMHTERATAFAKADAGHASAQPTLAAIARDATQPAIWRASALSRMALDSDSLDQLLVHLGDTDPIIRAEAARRSGELPRDWRQQHLIELASDPDLNVRLAAANSLADLGIVGATDAATEQLVKLDREYRSIAQRHMDQVETLAQLGEYEARQGNLEQAIELYTRAIKQNPQLVGAYINKADLQYRRADNRGAINTLRAGLAVLTGNPDLSFSLGLAFAREGLRDEALESLSDGASADNVRYHYVYAVALHDYGQKEAAIDQLLTVILRWPEDEQAHNTLLNYLANSGRIKEAADVAAAMARTWPENRQYANWARQLRSAKP